MNANSSDRKAVAFLSSLIVAGIAMLAVPWLLTPPAYLDLAVRDASFGSDLSAQSVALTDDSSGKTKTASLQKVGNEFVARIGRVRSGAGAYTARVTGYRPGAVRFQAAAMQSLRVPIELTPTFGRLELTTFNATRAGERIAATVKEGSRRISEEPQRVVTLDLPPGKHRFSAEAPGFCEAEREFNIRAGKTTSARLALSPDLTEDEIARFVLGWRNEPRDLDTHFRKLNASPNPPTVNFENPTGILPNGSPFAHLDVDEREPGSYETLTVRNTATGEYRYFVHLYDGSGTIAGAAATVQVYTRGCRTRTFTPPPNCTSRDWNVANVRYDGNRVELVEQQRCASEEVSKVRKSGR